MRSVRLALGAAILLLTTSCLGQPRPAGYDESGRIARGPRQRPAAPDDAALAAEARLDAIVPRALAQNPELAERRARVGADLARADSVGSLPTPELTAEVMGVPLRRPYAWNEAGWLMVGVRQSFPAVGSRGARARAEVAGASASAWDLAARERDIIRDVERAYYEYATATAELGLHEGHVELGRSMVDALRAAYRAGRASQQDILLAELDAERLHAELFGARQRQVSARAALNALMGRAVDAPLGAPPPLEVPPPLDLDAAALARLQAEKRPELAAAAAEIRRNEATRDAAARERSWPMFMLEADYMAMPQEEMTHGYRLMVSVGLPWLSGRSRADVRVADAELEVARRGAHAARLAAAAELADARARLDAARASYKLTEETLLPQADRAYEAGLASFATPSGNAIVLLQAFRVRIDLRIERLRALARLSAAHSDLVRAVGADIPRRQP